MANITIQSETTRVNFVDYAGDTIVMQFAYKIDGVLVDLSSAEIVLEIRKNQTDVEPILQCTKTSSTITSTLDANIIVELSDTTTATLGVGEFYFFVKLIQNTRVNTLIVGKLILKVR